jgi:hypothetical protein
MRVRVAGVGPVSQAEQAVEGIQGMLDPLVSLTY